MHIVLGGWRIDTLSRIAVSAGHERKLSPRAVRLIEALSLADGAFLTREELLDAIWPTVNVGDESLTQVVSEVRSTLQDPGIIKTVPKSGYRLRSVSTKRIASHSNPGADLRTIEAHALCMEARNEVVRCGRGSIEHADSLTREAVELAPENAHVRAERAIALVRAHSYWSEGRFCLTSALTEAEVALRLAPDLALAHSAFGFAHARAGHWHAAGAAHENALGLAPRDPMICHNVAWYLMSCGRHRAAIAFFEQVSELEPQNIKGYLMAAQLCHRLDAPRSRRNAGRALQRARLRLNADPNDPRAITAEAVALALSGQSEAAYTALESIDVSGSSQAIYHASAMAAIGESDRAVTLLEELLDHGWRDPYWLNADPAFKSVDNRKFDRMRQSLLAS